MNYYLSFIKNNDNYLLKVLNYNNNGIHKKDSLIKKVYDNKLNNNIIRARSKILDYSFNNDFQYFLTATISSSFDRSDLNSFIKRVTRCFRELRQKYNNDLYYIIIPELHKDKKNWHLHGLIGGACCDLDIYKNKYGYYSLGCLDKIGFNSLSKIKCKDACNVYITKYITKNLAFGRCKNEHLFYTSHNLHTGNKLPLIKIDSELISNFDFDFSSDNIKLKKYFDLDFVTKLLQNYYKNKDLQCFIDNLESIS